MTRTRHAVFVMFLVACGSLAACGGEPVGRICDLGVTPEMTEVVVASPSLDCITRTCLRFPQGDKPLPPGGKPQLGNNGLCTAECASDDDCDRVPESPCVTGFTCGIAVTVGPFCCRKFCICKDYVVVPEDTGVLDTPIACDAANASNSCCNLEGRQDNPAYPLCRS